jgi:hypothetical protein
VASLNFTAARYGFRIRRDTRCFSTRSMRTW